jgi:coproporphyrinogen III oxidase
LTTAPEARQETAREWFEALRDRICAAFERLEDTLSGPALDLVGDTPPGRFERTPWTRAAGGGEGGGGGGGVMAVMRGRVFEKVGVNVSAVEGRFGADFAGQIPGTEQDPRFWASGISLVAHMQSPLTPAVHMNTRHIVTAKSWFGGGADITPMFPQSEAAKADAARFHEALKAACDEADPAITRNSRPGATTTSTCPTGASRAGSAASSSTTSIPGTGTPISPSPGPWAKPSSAATPPWWRAA